VAARDDGCARHPAHGLYQLNRFILQLPSREPSGSSRLRDSGHAAVLDAKRQYRDAILFFRMGDFYEMFYEDALVAAGALELTLIVARKTRAAAPSRCAASASRGRHLPGAAGQKGLSRCDLRAVRRSAQGGAWSAARSRVVSPGTLIDVAYSTRATRVSHGRGARGDTLGVALIDLSTGEFSAAECRRRRPPGAV
jgi:DNA mismatch repair protein MutS